MVIRQWGALVVGSVIVGLTIGALVLYPRYESVITAQLKEWKVVPLPEPLTELYFEDHLTLPSRVVSGDPISFRFTIHNVEYRTVSYFYTIDLEGETTREVKRGTSLLEHDKSATIPIDLEDVPITTRSAIVVNLPEQDQRIHFWVEPK